MRKYLPSRLKRRVRRWLLDGAGSTGDGSRASAVEHYRYVFIVTYGRSGSTLLMSLLNTIPGYRIVGENYNALHHLYQAVAAAKKGAKENRGPEHLRPQSAWYGMPRTRPDAFQRDLVDSFVVNILRPEPGDRVLGFKEIRYTEHHVPDLESYLAFLQNTFPGCKIVFNHRDAAAVSKSSWWTKVGKAVEKVKAVDARLWAVPADDSHFHFVYDNIDDELTHIRALFKFLGEELDEPAVREVLDIRHSPPAARFTADANADGPAHAGGPANAGDPASAGGPASAGRPVVPAPATAPDLLAQSDHPGGAERLAEADR
jgi:hypothetical protein